MIKDILWLSWFNVLTLLLLLGLGLFATGMVRAKNTVDVLTKSLIAIGLCLVLSTFNGSYAMTLYNLSISTVILPFEAKMYASNPFFNTLLSAAPLVILAGVTAERLKLWAFILFSLFFVLVPFPLMRDWVWEEGLLARLGFVDLAGSSVIYLTSVAASSAALLFLGQRQGYRKQVALLYPRGANLPLTVIGFALVWLGTLGLNSAGFLLHHPAITLETHSLELMALLMNSQISVAAGMLSILVLLRLFYEKVDLTLMLNGGLAATAALAAVPNMVQAYHLLVISVVAAVLAVLLVFRLEKWGVDDPTGFIPSLGIGAVIGLLFDLFMRDINGGNFNLSTLSVLGHQILIQCLGIVIVFGATFIMSMVAWWIIRLLIGVRVAPSDEQRGLDLTHFGMQAYPEFTSTGEEH